MSQDQTQQLQKYLGIFLRKQKLILFCCLLAAAVGLGAYLRMPKIYKATSMLIYQTQSINPSRRALDVQSRLRDMVSTVSQQVTSRSSLEEIIMDLNLFHALRQKLPMENVVAVMRKQISTELDNRGDVFQVSFHGSDPKKVTLVTNALAARFIEENLRFREERASETSSYVKDELQMAKEALDKKEAIMRDYKLKYYNEMPEQLQLNATRLNALQEQQQNNQASIQDMERTRALIQEQISLRREILVQTTARLKAEAANSNNDPLMMSPDAPQDISRLRRELYTLRSRYTDDHPEVKRTMKLLKEAEVYQTGLLTPATETTQKTASIDPQIGQLRRQLQDIEYNITNLQQERQGISQQIEQYQQWIAAAPVREAEWSGLTRDYDQFNDHYQQLVAQKLQAEATESLERRQKGSQFKIIEPAHLPGKPFSPDFKKIMLMALGVGLGIGGGIAFLLETMDTSFKDPAELEAALGIQVTCSIPVLPNRKEKRRVKWAAAFWAVLFSLAVLFLLAALVYFWRTGAIII